MVFTIRNLILFVVLLLSACGGTNSVKDNTDTPKHNIMNLNTEGIQESSPLELNREQSEKKKVLILVEKGVSPEAVIHEYGGEVEQSYEEMNMAAGVVAIDEIERMKQDSRIIYLEIDKPVELKPAQTMDWGNINIQLPSALASNFTGKGVKVSIIDSGISNHEDLVIAGGVSMVSYTPSYEDDNGHGTHVAGIIGAKNNNIGIIGVAPDSELYAIKVLDQNGEGFTSDIIAGIDWSIQNNMDVINLSLGSRSHSPLMELMVNRAASQNIVIVSATGNDGTITGVEDNVSYPARYTNTIAVGAVDKYNRRAPFSSTGSTVDLVAPGVGILSTYLNNAYARMDGTSSATPFVSGVAALLKQINPSLSFSDVRSLLHKESLELGIAGRDNWYGFGLVQAPFYFRDIYGHWARNDIVTVFESGWMVGLPDQRFFPSKGLTRAEGAAILVRILGLQAKTNDILPFGDIPQNHWAYNDIRVAFQHGLMVGITREDFQPRGNLTREQMVVMLSRVLQPGNQGGVGSVPFTDILPSRWSYQAIADMYEMGVVSGITTTKFAPQKSVTRAEMAAILNRISPQIAP